MSGTSIEERLTRIETKLDTALGAIGDHETRLRELEAGPRTRSGNPHNQVKSDIIRLLLGAVLALAGAGTAWSWLGGR